MSNNKIVDDCFPSLSNDHGVRGRSFSPYKQDARHWLGRLKDNASVIGLGLAIAMAVA